ncbi:MAG TPA: hypothetical protein VFC21_08935 [Bryobacteraceae bacterium]|nr:hypothetical protein [Bryobacteraceae bacterium]
MVSGLPRSGTSMLMQMLAAGGIPVLTDGIRESDEDNPKGYFELEAVKSIRSGAPWLSDAKGKAVKIVAPLLDSIPPEVPCRVILIERDVGEVLDSQARMLARRHEPLANTPERREILRREYGRLLARIRLWLERRPGTGYLIVNRAAILHDPVSQAERIRIFLDGVPDAALMAGAVDPGLNRNRG